MSPLSMRRQIAGLIGWLGASFATAAVGAAASVQAGSFYTGLARPDWAPPPWIFGPVWTVLFALMGIAAWLVWRASGFASARLSLTLFLVQLVFNAAWSWLFFGWQLGALALLDVVVLFMLIAAMLPTFWRKSRLAGLMIAPYLVWVGFASLLNYTVWQLNPQQLG